MKLSPVSRPVSRFIKQKITPFLLAVLSILWTFTRYTVKLTIFFLALLLVFIVENIRELTTSVGREFWHYLRTFNHKVEQKVTYEQRRNLVALNLLKMMLLLGILAPTQGYTHAEAVTSQRIAINAPETILPQAMSAESNEASTTAQEMKDGAEFRISSVDRDSTDAENKALLPRKIRVKVRSGDTLGKILDRNGVDAESSYKALSSLKDTFNPRRLMVGQEIELTFDARQDEIFSEGAAADARNNAGTQFAGLTIFENVERDIIVSRDESGEFKSAIKEKPLTRVVDYREGLVSSSLFIAGQNAGIPHSIMIELVDAYSYDVDFQREIRKGDRFAVFFEKFLDANGDVVRTGGILKATLNVRGDDMTLYGYQADESAYTQYFDATGQSVRRALLRTPLKYGRISSNFGMRRHPIAGYNRMHTGTDFAAPVGTPIRASGDGVITRRGRNGGYGHYVEIRHNSQLSTAYAHMSRYANGQRVGTRVKQGEIIGYVGSTGYSTGPHLHYEVIKNDRKVNPMTIKLPTGKKLDGEALAAYKAHIGKVDEKLVAFLKGKDNSTLASAKE